MEKFVLPVPDFSSGIYFERATVSFLVIAVTLVIGLLICFWGYKYFQKLLLVALGCLSGAVGLKVGMDMTDDTVFQMCFFSIFIFLGICFFYFLSILFMGLLRILHLREILQKKLYLIGAVIGAGIIGGVTYFCVYQSGWLAAGLFLLLTVWGGLHGKRRAAERKPFYTYDDLCRREPLAEGGEDA